MIEPSRPLHSTRPGRGTRTLNEGSNLSSIVQFNIRAVRKDIDPQGSEDGCARHGYDAGARAGRNARAAIRGAHPSGAWIGPSLPHLATHP